MASIVTRPNGHRWIQWSQPERKTLRLGKVNRKVAEQHCRSVESILATRTVGLAIDPEVARFVGSLPEQLRRRYAACGLVDFAPETSSSSTTLKDFMDSFFGAKASEAKESSQTVWSHTRKRLLEYFGPDCELVSIDASQARAFRQWLETSNKRDRPKDEKGNPLPPKPLASNTIRKRIGICREIFGQALEDGLVMRNAFAGLPATVRANKDRQHYVDLQTFSKVLAAAPSKRWKALLVLARIGGLRVPSEIVGLRWSHVSADGARLTVLSPKTAHHEGRDSRVIPLLAPIKKALDELWHSDETPEGADRIFEGINESTNLRTTFLKIIARAGVKPWPKLWQNLRASAATDFARELPAHVASSICGHSIQIAREHYWQSTGKDFDDAISVMGDLPEPDEAKQNPKQHIPALGSTSGQDTSGCFGFAENPAISQGNAGSQWTTLDSNQ